MSEVTVINAGMFENVFTGRELIIDFSNGWHHSIRIEKGISVNELVESLHDFAKSIDNNCALK